MTLACMCMCMCQRGDFPPPRRDLARKCSRLLAMEGNDVAMLIRNSCAEAVTVDEEAVKVFGVQQAGDRERSAPYAYVHTHMQMPTMRVGSASVRPRPACGNRSIGLPICPPRRCYPLTTHYAGGGRARQGRRGDLREGRGDAAEQGWRGKGGGRNGGARRAVMGGAGCVV